METVAHITDRMKSAWHTLVQRDQAAKEAGVLVDRYIEVFVPGGIAFYRVESIRGKSALVVWQDVEDGLTHPAIGERAWIDKKWLLRQLELRHIEKEELV